MTHTITPIAGASVAPSASAADRVQVAKPRGPAADFFNGFRDAMHDYPEEFVTLEIVEVSIPGTALNTSEEGSFKVRLTNNGLLDITDVRLKVRGVNGTLVKTGYATDTTWHNEVTVGMEDETIPGQGGVSLTLGSALRLKAPLRTKPAGTELVKATIESWNGSLLRILNGHSHNEDVAPAGTYSNSVVAQ